MIDISYNNSIILLVNKFSNRNYTPYPNNDPLQSLLDLQNEPNCIAKLNWLKNSKYWNTNKMTGGVGRRSIMYNMQLRW